MFWCISYRRTGSWGCSFFSLFLDSNVSWCPLFFTKWLYLHLCLVSLIISEAFDSSLIYCLMVDFWKIFSYKAFVILWVPKFQKVLIEVLFCSQIIKYFLQFKHFINAIQINITDSNLKLVLFILTCERK